MNVRPVLLTDAELQAVKKFTETELGKAKDCLRYARTHTDMDDDMLDYRKELEARLAYFRCVEMLPADET